MSDEELVEELKSQGIVPGARIVDYAGDEGTVWSTDKWIFNQTCVIVGGRTLIGCSLHPSGKIKSFASVMNVPAVLESDVKRVLDKHPEAYEALKQLHPDLVPPPIYQWSDNFKLNSKADGPLYIGKGFAPDHLENKCLIVGGGYQVELKEYKGRQILVFSHKR